MGAVLGPCIALLYLYFYPNDYRTLFLLAFIPGICAVLFSFIIKEKKKIPVPTEQISPVRFFAFFSYCHYPANFLCSFLQ